jgi:uncharacterized protein (DUF305 family)
MRNICWNYSLVGLILGGSLTGLLLMNRTQAQTQGKIPEHNPYHSSIAMGMGMSMGMNQEQVDRHFIEMMIPHHEGAVDMANLALGKAQHPELKKLAEAIKTSQTKEIEEMRGWYKKWYGIEVPNRAGMGMGMGMMQIDLNALKSASNFDRVFIEQMIPHHQMAVMMAAMILDSPHPELRNLGRAVIQTQSAEIEQMWQWDEVWFNRN